MRNLAGFYIAICVLAVGLKFIIKAVQTSPGGKSTQQQHEQEHDRAHLIKFIILFIIAFVLIFFIGDTIFFNT
jgi:hypothetical protein